MHDKMRRCKHGVIPDKFYCAICDGLPEDNIKRDNVNHPPHYTTHKSRIECIQITEHMNFCLGNAIKYLWRADSKGKMLEDLKKASWYVNREIQRLEKQKIESSEENHNPTFQDDGKIKPQMPGRIVFTPEKGDYEEGN